jgi:LmbE family N-acetylglucosaminyl deacetylase
MKVNNKGAEVFVPDNQPVEYALSRTTCMSIAAHQDDLEIMAYHGILQCFGRNDEWFTGVVVTDGAGSARKNMYVNYSDDEMKKIRKNEQKKAAFVGEYGAVVLLDYSSSQVKDSKNLDVVEELKELILIARPKIIYTHNLADKHDTHISVALRTIKAIRELPRDIRPDKLIGCEVWRSLDWLNDEDKVLLDVSGHPNIAASLVGIYDSQISGGKRYDLATSGRRLANATYFVAHDVDNVSALIYGMDLKPLVDDENMDINQYVQNYINHFSDNVSNRLMELG